MSLRTVAGETPRLCRSASVFEPTGSFVDTKSSTIARRTSSLRSSSTDSCTSLALPRIECQVYGATPRSVAASGPRHELCDAARGEAARPCQGGVRHALGRERHHHRVALPREPLGLSSGLLQLS